MSECLTPWQQHVVDLMLSGEPIVVCMPRQWGRSKMMEDIVAMTGARVIQATKGDDQC